MPLDFTPSWMSAELADGRASCERFVEREMLPADEAARRAASSAMRWGGDGYINESPIARRRVDARIRASTAAAARS